ncbi:MAG: ABC transporter permease [Nitrospirae bacterium]|nr:ABC transporter permease [Nitrospirota bacterium]
MLSKIAIVLLLVIAASSISAPLLTPYDPLKIDLYNLKKPPSLEHPFGTDNKGRDVLSRVLYGGRFSLGISLFAGVLSLFVGLCIGLLSGYYGGKIDMAFMMVVDLVLAFPSLLLAIGISVLLPPGVYTVIIAISLVGWASFARLIRGYVLRLKESPFIDAARAIGCTNRRILIKHILPNCLPLSFVVLGVKLGGYILTESALSFLGLGVQPPMPSWGSMISLNRVYITSAPAMVIFSGLAIVLTAFCFNVIGDALRDKWEIRSEK